MSLIGDEAVRGRRAIGNRPRWALDVVFADDRSRLRKGHGPRTMAVRSHLTNDGSCEMVGSPRTPPAAE